MTVNEHNRATTIRSRRSALFSSAIVLVVGALLSAGLAHVHQRMLDRARTQYVEQSGRTEEHTSELQPLMCISYAVSCLKKNNATQQMTHHKKSRINTHYSHSHSI